MEHMIEFFPVYADISGGAAVTAMDPRLIAKLVVSLNARNTEVAASFCAALHEYMHFLGQTGRWSGSQESLRVLHGVLYYGMHNEEVSPAGWPRTRAAIGREASPKSA
ncbi:hypothetical protein G9E11_07735 [Arthrobacter sp. IA7]|uniref:hypothetical protein n=1 Tax=Arthrobacter ipis TaxID=2716202 RepID=UPI0016849A41|nr:hypothetical protein [Arthrobacter ipis]MBD1542137.1 hypothetical protein [Arthrobacter ipis]